MFHIPFHKKHIYIFSNFPITNDGINICTVIPKMFCFIEASSTLCIVLFPKNFTMKVSSFNSYKVAIPNELSHLYTISAIVNKNNNNHELICTTVIHQKWLRSLQYSH